MIKYQPASIQCQSVFIPASLYHFKASIWFWSVACPISLYTQLVEVKMPGCINAPFCRGILQSMNQRRQRLIVRISLCFSYIRTDIRGARIISPGLSRPFICVSAVKRTVKSLG